ncbi:MAG: bifunctional riboflavin kinase/FAD synthetase [Thiotrichaceae bacterium]|nr:bifunctional riboflavin kinase/FAD synthetase [Thiotrichaceae bacterium]
MEFIRHLKQLRPQHRGCVATIGNFDGVHLGHQAVLQQVAQRAAALNLPTTVILFEPQPAEFFAPKTAPSRLTRLREKLIALQSYGVDRVLCVQFNAAFAALTADEFIQQVLVEGLGVQHLVIGDDFQFGKGRAGNFNTLQQAGIKFGFAVERQTTFSIDGERVSSTRVRQALVAGDLPLANQLLGREYSICGRVGYGQQRGRTIDFPTANLKLYRLIPPLKGVFAVTMHGIDAQAITGVANLGTRPTVNGQDFLLEVHLFDFNQVIYGRYVSINFLKKIRDEQRFADFNALKQQIECDGQQARAFFANKT